MIWQKHTLTPLERIARTGFLVSLASYLVFWLTDLIQPGFVSRYFSVHIFLLAMFIFGVVWASVMKQYTDRPWVHTPVVMVFGIVLAILTWSLATELEVYRVPLVLIAFCTPSILYVLIKNEK